MNAISHQPEHSDLIRMEDKTLALERRLIIESITTKWEAVHFWVKFYQDIFSDDYLFGKFSLDSFEHLTLKQRLKKMRNDLAWNIERLEAIIEEQERRKIP